MRPMPLTLAALVGLALAGPAAAAGVLDRLKETGEIRLGVREDAAPLSYLDEAGDPAGYSVLVCDAVADRLAEAVGRDELTRTWVPVGSEEGLDAVAEGRVDLLCGAVTITLERRAQVDFSIPTFVDGAAVILPRDADPEFTALAGKKAGVRADTTTEAVLRDALAAAGVEAEVVTFPSHADGVAALEAGEIAAYFGDQSILFDRYFDSAKRDELVVSDNTLTVEKHGLALPRGDDDFRLAVDTALSELYHSGAMVEFFGEALPGASPGVALKSLFLIAPDMP